MFLFLCLLFSLSHYSLLRLSLIVLSHTLFTRISFPQRHPTVAFHFFREKKLSKFNSIQCISINLWLLLCVFFSLRKDTNTARERERGKSVCLCCTNSIVFAHFYFYTLFLLLLLFLLIRFNTSSTQHNRMN